MCDVCVCVCVCVCLFVATEAAVEELWDEAHADFGLKAHSDETFEMKVPTAREREREKVCVSE